MLPVFPGSQPHIYLASAALLIFLLTRDFPKCFRMVLMLVYPVTCMISLMVSMS
jgi:hypothetical protein